MTKKSNIDQSIIEFFASEQEPLDEYVAMYYPHGEREPDPLRNTKRNKAQIISELDPVIDKIFTKQCKTDTKFCQKPSKALRDEIKEAFFESLETMASEPSESELHRMWRP